MAHTTIEQFATELKLPPGALLEQLTKAGVAGKNEGDGLSEQDKTKLLEYLQKQHGAAGEPKKKITLTRKQTTEIKAAGSTGKARTIQVEVRKKRVFVKRDETETAPVVEEPAKPVAAPLISDEELAAREAEEKQGAGADRPPAGRGAEEAGAGGQAQDEERARSRGGGGQGRCRRSRRRRRRSGEGDRDRQGGQGACGEGRHRGHVAPSRGQTGRAGETDQEERRGIPGGGRAASRAQAAWRRHGRHHGRWLAAAEGRRPAPRRGRWRRRRARGGESRSSAT